MGELNKPRTTRVLEKAKVRGFKSPRGTLSTMRYSCLHKVRLDLLDNGRGLVNPSGKNIVRAHSRGTLLCALPRIAISLADMERSAG